jgi:hypothetical protein
MQVPECQACAEKDEAIRRLKAAYIREQATANSYRAALASADAKISQMASALPDPPATQPEGLPSSDWIVEGAADLARKAGDGEGETS